MRSRSKWLKEGEAPTKYFFSLAKAKFSRDRIPGLQLSNGEVITRRKDILKVVEEYYSELYNSEGESLENRLARQEILQLINRRISESEAARLNEVPTDEEVDNTIKSLKRDDTSLFIKATARDFQRARTCIDKFEKASGTLLNVQKSMVMALRSARSFGWLRDSGCLVASPRRRFKYLGVWSGLDAKGVAKINRTIRQFLWGYAAGGKPKVSLVAWWKLHLTKGIGRTGMDGPIQQDEVQPGAEDHAVLHSGGNPSRVDEISSSHLERNTSQTLTKETGLSQNFFCSLKEYESNRPQLYPGCCQLGSKPGNLLG
ncbi:hypothetical protein R1sor_012370 [Riccia sorocarpa]|uniref:Uncharacterized protein n=1 Tax=Riccia sorocarpa TaxID=122646 RepID=A0ABD3I6W2_9MARC